VASGSYRMGYLIATLTQAADGRIMEDCDLAFISAPVVARWWRDTTVGCGRSPAFATTATQVNPQNSAPFQYLAQNEALFDGDSNQELCEHIKRTDRRRSGTPTQSFCKAGRVLHRSP